MTDNQFGNLTREETKKPGKDDNQAISQQYPQVNVGVKTPVSEKLEQILMWVYFVVGAVLIFRFVLSLFGANRGSLFVNFVYQLTTPFMFPFENMFGHQPQVGQFMLEFEVVVALLVYALVFMGIARLVRILSR